VILSLRESLVFEVDFDLLLKFFDFALDFEFDGDEYDADSLPILTLIENYIHFKYLKMAEWARKIHRKCRQTLKRRKREQKLRKRKEGNKRERDR
jgi:hypothetical protein